MYTRETDSNVQPGQNIVLTGSINLTSGKVVFPSIPETSPAHSLYEPIKLTAPATLYSYTVIHPNPKTGKPPYILVYADFPEGARVFGRLDCAVENISIGMSIDVVGDSDSDSDSDSDRSYVFAPSEEK